MATSAAIWPSISAEETHAAQKAFASSVPRMVVRTPLVRLNHGRADLPELEIFLKLETLQPINSFKIRGATNALSSVSPEELKTKFDNTIVSASAGNMGQGMAYVAKQRGARCVVVVPEMAPQAKTKVIEEEHQGEIVRVPYARWWEIIETGDASKELEGKPHLFMHPVVDRRVVAGNSTIAAEIIEDLPDVDAVLAPWGGGGLCCGIGSYLKAAGSAAGKAARLISCEPITASPLTASLREKVMCSSFADYKPSFIDGCGGKAVLPAMWPLAQELVHEACAVELEDVEEAIRILATKNKVIAEGAGAVALAAVLFGPRERLEKLRKVVCVVCGGCIDQEVLLKILRREELVPRTPVGPPVPKVFSASDVRRLLPMSACIEAAAEAMRALSEGKGAMPLRQVNKLPLEPESKVGFFALMPCYLDGFAAAKVITVFPGNTGTPFPSHQGSLLLFRAANHGELLFTADAHEVTKIRTAAASAAATRAILEKHAKPAPKVLAIVGTGGQARSHCEAMLELFGGSLKEVRLFGRNSGHLQACEADVRELAKGRPEVQVFAHALDELAVHGPQADLICTVTHATEAILSLAHVKKGAHVCAVGACTPNFCEASADLLGSLDVVYCDTKAACQKEPGDIVRALASGAIKEEQLLEVGLLIKEAAEAATAGKQPAKSEEAEKTTLFKSVGMALEDLTAARVIYEKASS